ncbi:MAG: DMT family transporter [Alphaproteobacteria bacterium]|nr:DMT family transporter [Alphaproteobacteria bacterium]
MTTTPTPGRRLLLVPSALLLVGGIAYGSMFSANKMAVDAGMPVMAYAFWQALFASAVLLGASVLLRQPPQVNVKTLRLFVMVAAMGLVGPLLVFASVADRVPPGVLTLIVALIPATTYLLSLILRMDRFRWLSVAGVAVGFAGILLIVLPSGSLESSGAALWVVFALLVPVFAAFNNMLGERLTVPGVSTLGLAGGMFSVATVFLLIAMLASDGFVPITRAGANGIYAVLWATAAQTITYVSFFEIIRRAGGVFFALLNYVVVAAGLVWANILFGEHLSLWVWLAVILVAISLALMNIGTARALKERQG